MQEVVLQGTHSADHEVGSHSARGHELRRLRAPWSSRETRGTLIEPPTSCSTCEEARIRRLRTPLDEHDTSIPGKPDFESPKVEKRAGGPAVLKEYAGPKCQRPAQRARAIHAPADQPVQLKRCGSCKESLLVQRIRKPARMPSPARGPPTSSKLPDDHAVVEEAGSRSTINLQTGKG